MRLRAMYPQPLRPQSQGSLMRTGPGVDFPPQEDQRYSRNALLPQVGWEGQLAGVPVGFWWWGPAASALLPCVSRRGRSWAPGPGRRRRGGTVQPSASDSPRLGRSRTAEGGLGCRVPGRPEPPVPGATLDLRLNQANVREVVQGFELVLDASDNFPTRFLVSECCWQEGIPLVSAAATGWHGQLLVVRPGAENPCYRCLVPEAPPAAAVPSSSQVGILGAVAGTMGCLQAVEALKLLLGLESDLNHRLLAYDGLQGRFQSLARVKSPDCPLCGLGK